MDSNGCLIDGLSVDGSSVRFAAQLTELTDKAGKVEQRIEEQLRRLGAQVEQLVVQVAATRQDQLRDSSEWRERIKVIELHAETSPKAELPARPSVASSVKSAARALEVQSPRSNDAGSSFSPGSPRSTAGAGTSEPSRTQRWRQERGRWSRESSVTTTPVKQPDSGGTAGDAFRLDEKMEQLIVRLVAQEAKAAISRFESAQEQFRFEQDASRGIIEDLSRTVAQCSAEQVTLADLVKELSRSVELCNLEQVAARKSVEEAQLEIQALSSDCAKSRMREQRYSDSLQKAVQQAGADEHRAPSPVAVLGQSDSKSSLVGTGPREATQHVVAAGVPELISTQVRPCGSLQGSVECPAPPAASVSSYSHYAPPPRAAEGSMDNAPPPVLQEAILFGRGHSQSPRVNHATAPHRDLNGCSNGLIPPSMIIPRAAPSPGSRVTIGCSRVLTAPPFMNIRRSLPAQAPSGAGVCRTTKGPSPSVFFRP